MQADQYRLHTYIHMYIRKTYIRLYSHTYEYFRAYTLIHIKEKVNAISSNIFHAENDTLPS